MAYRGRIKDVTLNNLSETESTNNTGREIIF